MALDYSVQDSAGQTAAAAAAVQFLFTIGAAAAGYTARSKGAWDRIELRSMASNSSAGSGLLRR